jgi:hypothetical protein
MATAPAVTGPQATKPRQEMVEIKAPVQFQFAKINQMAVGVLISIEPVVIKGKEALEYLFRTEDGAKFTCLGTNDLNKKLGPELIGCKVEITYLSDDTSFQKPGQSPAKVFRVRASKDKEPGF